VCTRSRRSARNTAAVAMSGSHGLSRRLAILVALVGALAGCSEPQSPQPPQRPPAARVNLPYVPATSIQTNHYVIHSSASIAQTTSVAMAVEALYRAYAGEFGGIETSSAFHLVLYKDQLEFKRNNHSSPWAQAYYKRPYSFAYAGDGASAHHWMLHEATHQLITEATGRKPRRWLNEGIASYFGTSDLSEGKLDLGRPDPDTYPVWWLSDLGTSSESRPTFQGEPLFSLKALIEDTGPPIDQHVNHYYVAYWSPVHYLFHGDNEVHRKALPELLDRNGDPSAFTHLIGSYETIEPRWQEHLAELAMVAKLAIRKTLSAGCNFVHPGHYGERAQEPQPRGMDHSNEEQPYH
jgi:hypothetical protein